jgi:translation initiation factor 2B subunit (eIF-2B alpha/beta/delta family)
MMAEIKMTDRLRSYHNGVHGDFFMSVADEIENLESENENLHLENDTLLLRCGNLKDEITSLRNRLKKAAQSEVSMENKTLHLDLTINELVALYAMAKHGIPFSVRSSLSIAVNILDRLRPQLHAQNVSDDFINYMMR